MSTPEDSKQIAAIKNLIS